MMWRLFDWSNRLFCMIGGHYFHPSETEIRCLFCRKQPRS